MLIIGVAGWLLPVIPGWALVIPGLLVLSKDFHWAHKALEHLKKIRPKRFDRS